MYYSNILATSNQIYREFIGDIFTQFLFSSGVEANNGAEIKKQSFSDNILIRLKTLWETFGLLFVWFFNNNNNMIINNFIYLIIIIILIILLFILHKPLPSFIADKFKIKIVELLMRLTNEYLGNLIELFFGPIMRNKFTRIFSSIPFYLFPVRAPYWCNITVGKIAGIKCRFYIPQGKAKNNNAIIVFIHGGGWCMGRPKFYDGALLLLIKKLGLTIISIDYSLSPEVKFPVALLECERVIEEIYNKKFKELDIDKNKIVLMGDSAGGCQCAVLCQRALRMEKKEMIKCQVLIYPVIHMLDFQSPSYQLYYNTYSGTGLLNPKMLARWYLFYLGIEPTKENIHLMIKNQHLSPKLLNDDDLCSILDSENLPKEFILKNKNLNIKKIKKENIFQKIKRKNYRNSSPIKWKITKKLKYGVNEIEKINEEKVEIKKENKINRKIEEKQLYQQIEPFLQNPDICPLLADNLKNHCPTIIFTAGIDVLRDEGFQYVKKLNSNGVKVEWKHFENAYHGIFNMWCSKQREEIINNICNYLIKNLK